MFWYFLLPCLGLCILWEFLKQEKQLRSDNQVGDEIGEDPETDKKLEEATEYDVWSEDSTELGVGEEDFDPESML